MVDNPTTAMTLRIPTDLYERLRARAFEQRTSMTALILQAVQRQEDEPVLAGQMRDLTAAYRQVRDTQNERIANLEGQLAIANAALREDTARITNPEEADRG